MNIKPFNLVMLLALLISCSLSIAAEKITAIISIAEPIQKIGIQVGDVLTRKVTILAKTGEKITPKFLPVKGTRTAGMELSKVNVSQAVDDAQSSYVIELSYQVFAHSTEAAKMVLPEEMITLVDGEDLTVPAWMFWYSPLVISDLDDAKTSLLPQAKAALINQDSNLLSLLAFAGLLLFSIIGIIYINADRYWLPFMGGNFARAHRQIKSISKKKAADTGAPKVALGLLHEAFNQLFDRGLYPNNIDTFLVSHPEFSRLKTEVAEFFDLSNQTLFTDKSSNNVMQKILSFSKQLRDCERGV